MRFVLWTSQFTNFKNVEKNVKKKTLTDVQIITQNHPTGFKIYSFFLPKMKLTVPFFLFLSSEAFVLLEIKKSSSIITTRSNI